MDSHGSGDAVEVEFEIHDADYPFVSASEAAAGPVELVEMIPRAGDEYAEFFTASGIDPVDVVDLAEDHDDLTASCLAEYDEGGLFEFVVSGNCPARRLAELGALPTDVRSVDGRGRIVAEIPPGHDAGATLETFLDEETGAELTRKQETDSITPPFSRTAVERELESRLTDRQREVLQVAFDAGYYDWPRECTGAEVADRLGITSATFSEHVHAAERKLIGLLLDET